MKNLLFSPIALGLATLWAVVFMPLTSSAQNAGGPDSLVRITTRLPGHVKPSIVTVAVENGIAFMQGDIELGPLEKLLNPPAQNRGLVMEDLDDRWGNGIIPYEIDEDFSPAYRDTILAAIDYINGSTNLLLVPRDGQFFWIDFEASDKCSSRIGLQEAFGQNVRLKDNTVNGSGCGFIQIIHEIAHAAGLWHEHCRADRDDYVNIHWENIKDEYHHDFEKDIDENIEIGAYDYYSRMHYFAKVSSQMAIDVSQPVITRTAAHTVNNNNQDMGNRSDYSSGDVAAINWLYPIKNCPILYLLSRPIKKVEQRLYYEASWFVNSNAAIAPTNEVTFDAGYEITLLPGFETGTGAKFHAVIEGCGGQNQPLNSVGSDDWYTEAGSYEDRLAQNLATLQTPSETKPDAGLELEIAPNPFAGSTTVTYSLPAEQSVTMELLDALGKRIATPMATQIQSAGGHQFSLEAGSLPAGMYFLVVRIGAKQETKRLVITR